MLDEHFMRQWNEVHEDFTADLHRTLNQLGRYRRNREAERPIIGEAYEGRRTVPLGERARAAARGFTAVVVTMALLAGGLAVMTAPYAASATPHPIEIA